MYVDNNNKKNPNLEKLKTAEKIDFKVSSTLMMSLGEKKIIIIIFRRNEIVCKKAW